MRVAGGKLHPAASASNGWVICEVLYYFGDGQENSSFFFKLLIIRAYCKMWAIATSLCSRTEELTLPAVVHGMWRHCFQLLPWYFLTPRDFCSFFLLLGNDLPFSFCRWLRRHKFCVSRLGLFHLTYMFSFIQLTVYYNIEAFLLPGFLLHICL